MRKNQAKKRRTAAALIVAIDKRYHRPLVITLSVVLLNIILGFDPKFTIINIIRLLPIDNK